MEFPFVNATETHRNRRNFLAKDERREMFSRKQKWLVRFRQVSRAVQNHDMCSSGGVCQGTPHDGDPICSFTSDRSASCAVGFNCQPGRLLTRDDHWAVGDGWN